MSEAAVERYGRKAEVAMKKIRCLLGFHNWKTFMTDGGGYLKCPDCGKYGGVPPRVWGYKGPSPPHR